MERQRNNKKVTVVATTKAPKSAGKKVKANVPVIVDQALIQKRQ